MKSKHLIRLTRLLLVTNFLWLALTIQTPAAESQDWTQLKPAGAHFTVQVPEQVDVLNLPKDRDIELRVWSMARGDRQYIVTAMYSEKGDFSSYINNSLPQTSEINGYQQREMTVPSTAKTPAARRMFYTGAHHAMIFAEIAPDMPQKDDQFFKSIEIEKENAPSHYIHVTCDNRFYVLLPSDFERSGNMWRGFDQNNRYLALEYWKSDPTNEIKKLEEKAEKAGSSALNVKKSFQGFEAWEFTVGEHHKYLVVKCPRMYYVFHCDIGNLSPEAQKAQEDFFRSIIIDKEANHPNF
ncbi:MAG: hypothetical protein JST89_05290 [Cyanobacteria bacterium SZAS-4]|nr:hypothetical protein [Cyanobacteria bacterium SZAS-4]